MGVAARREGLIQYGKGIAACLGWLSGSGKGVAACLGRLLGLGMGFAACPGPLPRIIKALRQTRGVSSDYLTTQLLPPMSFLFTQRLLYFLLLLLGATGYTVAQVPEWVASTSHSGSYANAAVTDADGNVYVAGRFRGITAFGAITLSSEGDYDAFVAKISSQGVYQWVVRAGGPNCDAGVGVAVDGGGNVFVTGTFSGLPSRSRSLNKNERKQVRQTPDSSSATFGPWKLTSTGNYDVFVAKLSPTGAWQWVSAAGGTSSDYSEDLVLDTQGNVVITGFYRSQGADFGEQTLSKRGPSNKADLFVAKLSSVGAWQWAVSAGGDDNEYSYAVTVDQQDNILLTGIFSSHPTSFGKLTLTGHGLFVAKLTPSGKWQWVTSAIGRGNNYSYDIALDRSDHPVITGYFTSDTLTFGKIQQVNSWGSNQPDAFVAKLTTDGDWQWVASVPGTGRVSGNSVMVDVTDHIVVAGSFSGPKAVFGSISLTNDVSDQDNVFVAKLTPAGSWHWVSQVGIKGSVRAERVAPDRQGGMLLTGYFHKAEAVFGRATLRTLGDPNDNTMFVARLPQLP